MSQNYPILISVSMIDDIQDAYKYFALFKVSDDKFKTVKFGSRNYKDYLTGTTDEQRYRYWKRHEKNLNLENPMTAGNLSLIISWTYRDINKSIKLFKKIFNV